MYKTDQQLFDQFSSPGFPMDRFREWVSGQTIFLHPETNQPVFTARQIAQFLKHEEQELKTFIELERKLRELA